jgi:dUTP pyrophosphatase
MKELTVSGRFNKDCLPHYGSFHAAGADLHADIEEELLLDPGDRILVPTGIFLQIPEGYEGQVRPRSGLALKHGITILNSPGTVDSDYRGEVKVILYNCGKTPFTIAPGLRIAQLVIAPVSRALFVEVEELEASGREAGGFGSTGI